MIFGGKPLAAVPPFLPVPPLCLLCLCGEMSETREAIKEASPDQTQNASRTTSVYSTCIGTFRAFWTSTV